MKDLNLKFTHVLGDIHSYVYANFQNVGIVRKKSRPDRDDNRRADARAERDQRYQCDAETLSNRPNAWRLIRLAAAVWILLPASAWAQVTLTASAVEATTATLTLTGHTVRNWHYKYTAPTGGTCSAVDGDTSGTTTVNLTSLSTNTSYTYKAYSDSVCNTEMASASPFLTKPGTPGKPTATAGVGSGTLTLAASVTGSGAITKWQYVKKEGAGNFETTWTDISVTSTSLDHDVTGLTNGTSYQFKVRAVNATGHGAASAASVAATPFPGVCDRTAEVRDAIVDAVTGKTTCSAITDADLAGILRLPVNNDRNFTALKSGDFAGLTALNALLLNDNNLASLPANIFDELTTLEELLLTGNKLTSLPDDIFDKLTVLKKLYLDENELSSLPADDIFDKLTVLDALRLGKNELTSLPANVFDKLTVLLELSLNDNALSSLPAGIFDKLDLDWLFLHNNSLTSLSAGVFDELTLLGWLTLSGNGLTCLPFISASVYTLDVEASAFNKACGAAVTVGATGVTVGAGQTATYTVVLDAYPRGNVTVTPASGAAGTATVSGALTFTQKNWSTAQSVTVTGVAAGSTTVSHVVSGGGGGGGSANRAPTFGAQAIADQTWQQGVAIEPLVLPVADGTPLMYTFTPPLPAGLNFDPATRTLSGTPTVAIVETAYTYTATYADGDSAGLTFTITVEVSAAEQAILEDGLAAQGRALLSGATGVIGERFRNPGASSVAETGVAACLGDAGPGAAGTEDAETEPECATGLLTTVAQAMLGMSGAGRHTDPWGLADADETRLRGPGLGNGGAQPAWDWESLIWGRSFALPLNAQGAPGSAWTLWGAGDIQGFEGTPRQGRYDGQVRSLYLGVDMQWQAHWLAGAALAQSWGETDYVAEPGGRAGQVETTLTSIYPYVRGTLGSGLEVWAIGGYGRGEAEQTQADGAGDTRDLTMAMGATGVRQPMTEVGGAQVALVGGAGYLSLATEEGNSTIADLDVAVNRARLAVEATWTAGGLAPYVQVGGRYDGGAGQTGAGLETVAGVRYTSERLEFEARGRWLATHAAEGYTEYGGLARLAVKPQADGTGFRMAVAPRWGAADGGAGVLGGGAALLDGGALPGLRVSGIQAATNQVLAVESELGYGVAVFDGQGVLTPYGGFALTGAETRQYRLGARLGMAQWLTLSLEGTRREATGPQPADQGVQLQLQGRF